MEEITLPNGMQLPIGMQPMVDTNELNVPMPIPTGITLPPIIPIDLTEKSIEVVI